MVDAMPESRGEDASVGRAGFSLVEMLVGVVITGLVGAAITGLFIEQTGFYGENSRRVMANKSLRATADRMSTELRMVRQGDVRTAEADRLEVRHGVMSGVVCHTVASTAYLYVHRLSGETDPALVRYLEPRFQGSWNTGLVWSSIGEDNSHTCADHGAPAGKSDERYREVDATPTPEAGSLVYGTIPLRYEFVSQDGRVALRRNFREVAAPFEASPPYFRYYREDGTELSAPVTGANRDDIAYVRVDATAQGHDPNQRYQGDRMISLRIPFRN